MQFSKRIASKIRTELMAQKLKESACNAGDLGLFPGSGRSPGEANGNPLQCSWPGEFHGQKSLAGYSPWGCKQSDTTEQLTLSLFTVLSGPAPRRHFHFLNHTVYDRWTNTFCCKGTLGRE